MSKALKQCQREDGFWNVSLHDPSNFGGKETSGTALFVYGMAWGVRNGLLDKKTYLPVIIKAWNAMVKDAVHPEWFSWLCTGNRQRTERQSALSHTTKFLILRISEQDVSFLPEVKSIN